MLRRRQASCVNFAGCKDTVTLYHAEYEPVFQCRRIVFEGAYLDQRTLAVEQEGQAQEEQRCFLVLPNGFGRPVWRPPGAPWPLGGSWFCLQPGDRVMQGQGPAVDTLEEWERFIPLAVEGLMVVQEVAVKRWLGKVSHLEAETRWYKRW